MKLPVRFLLCIAVIAFGSMQPARADDAATAYVVTYFEVAPASSGQAASLLRPFAAASRKENGNV